MSTELPSKSQTIRRGARVVIVAARYNEKFTSALLQNCMEELQENAEHVSVEVVRVPGAFEVPVMVRRAITQAHAGERPDVVIALGVILRGSTAHADLIGQAITQQLLSMACETLTPVIHEVLLLQDEQQAFARCVASSLNRGREAARAAISMLNLLEEQHALHSMINRVASVDPHGSLF